jgi:hypothetical protein
VRAAVLLTAEGRAKIGDVGLARFMPNDYLSTAAATGITSKCRETDNVQCDCDQTVVSSASDDAAAAPCTFLI